MENILMMPFPRSIQGKIITARYTKREDSIIKHVFELLSLLAPHLNIHKAQKCTEGSENSCSKETDLTLFYCRITFPYVATVNISSGEHSSRKVEKNLK